MSSKLYFWEVNTIVLNANTPSEEKSDDLKESCYEELKQIFDHIAKYYIKILLWYLDTVLGKEDIFKPTIGNKSLHQDTNNNGVKK
jgi:hypothetical protein